MELRSNRSRSKTPSIFTQFEEEIAGGSHVEHTFSKNTRRTISTTYRTHQDRNSSNTLTEEYSANSRIIKPSSTRRSPRSETFLKTSDYSSEGENEVSSTKSIDDNEKNRMKEEARTSVESGRVTALGFYRRAKRYWDEYPKTDWTYSRLSKDRVEIAPGVVAMPNMSRRHIHKYTNTEDYDEVDDSHFAGIRPQALFTNNNYDHSFSSATNRSFKSVIIGIFMSIFTLIKTVIFTTTSNISYGYRSVHSGFVWIAKIIHRLTSWVMLMDTWLLRKHGSGEKRNALIALCLIPLMLFSGWWFLSDLSNTLYHTLSESFPSLTLEMVREEGVDRPPNYDLFQPYQSEDTPERLVQASQNLHFELPHLTKEQLQVIADLIRKKLNEDVNAQRINAEDVVQQLIRNPTFLNIINNDRNVDSGTEFMESELRETINNLQKELDAMKMNLNHMAINVHNNQRICNQLNRCCRKPIVNVESYVTQMLNNPDFLAKQNGLNDWLRTMFVAKADLEVELANLTRNLNAEFDALIRANGKIIMDEVTSKITREIVERSRHQPNAAAYSGSLDDGNVRSIVKKALTVYDADKTGLVDYAMEPMGGQVITTRCTESYDSGSAVVSILGVPLWYASNTPRTVITPGINPGECWAFQNFPGFLVIKLVAPIRIEAFSYEHISKLLVPNGWIDSAPRQIQIYGLQDENDKLGVKIGEYLYDSDGDSLQYFAAQEVGLVFHYIELRVVSNHGNPNYTCLYRFRVHGSLVKNT